MDFTTNGVCWLTVDDTGQELNVHGSEDGGLIVAAGSRGDGMGALALDRAAGFRMVAAILNLLDGDPVEPEAKDLLSLSFQVPHWTVDVVLEDGVRRGLMIANAGDHVVLCVGRVRTAGANLGAVTIPLEDARRLADAALAILEGVDPWEVTG